MMSEYRLESPGKNLLLVIEENEGRLTYSVKKNDVVVICPSPIGAITEAGDLTNGLSVTASETEEISEEYQLPAYKKSACLNHCRQMRLSLEKAGYEFILEARAYDEGAAIRLVFPRKDVFIKELTGFKLGEDVRSIYASRYFSNHEEDYVRISRDDIGQNKWSFPVLVEAGANTYALITEAAVNKDYGSSMLGACAGQDGLLMIEAVPDSGERVTPFEIPWRVVLAGSLDEIVNSDVIESLNPGVYMNLFSKRAADTSFVKGGVMATTAIAEPGSIGNFTRQKEYIDYAAKMKWPYFLIEGDWREQKLLVPALVKYAASKNVAVWVSEDYSKITVAQ